jgi:thiosulfate/3-mercaptopyruvate sulfurtransferase
MPDQRRIVIMKRLLSLLFLAVLLFGAEPWSNRDVVQPEQIARDTKPALLIHVGFPVLYRATHIPGSQYAGPGSKSEGIEDLKKAVAGQPHEREIVLYCGCCPWDKCPNIRPAFAALHDLGFTNIKVMAIPESFKTDWIDKGYPTEKHTE